MLPMIYDLLFENMPVSLDASFLTILVSISISIFISISSANLDRFSEACVCAYACDYGQLGQGLQYGRTEVLMWFRGAAGTAKGLQRAFGGVRWRHVHA